MAQKERTTRDEDYHLSDALLDWLACLWRGAVMTHGTAYLERMYKDVSGSK